MSTKTYTVRESEIERRWYVVDAADETLGRLASRIARVLEGKHKPTWSPNLDTGDHVIVLNARKISVSAAKLTTKSYQRHRNVAQKQPVSQRRTLSGLKDYGLVPDFTGIQTWLNTPG